MLRCLNTKSVAWSLVQKAGTVLFPLQLGVGPQGGGVSAGIDELAKTFPEILEWVKACYSISSKLLFGCYVILSLTGWHQGDPRASLLFTSGLQQVLIRIKEEVPTLLLSAWYHGYGTEVGRLEELEQVVDILERERTTRGLQLSTMTNQPKCVVWCPHHVGGADAHPLQRGIPRETRRGGPPAGSPSRLLGICGENCRRKG